MTSESCGEQDAALERLNNPDYREWQGDERLRITGGTLLRLTFGRRTKYVVHSMEGRGRNMVGIADHFARQGGEFEYRGSHDRAFIRQSVIEEKLAGKLFYLRAIIDYEDLLFVPGAQPIEVAQTINEHFHLGRVGGH